jgi:hypothetical protein
MRINTAQGATDHNHAEKLVAPRSAKIKNSAPTPAIAAPTKDAKIARQLLCPLLSFMPRFCT